jgi:hypothetical protein
VIPMKRVGVMLAVGLLLIATSWIFIRHSEGESFGEIFSLEPKYDGHRLTYWMGNYLNPWDSHPRAEAQRALDSAGTRAIPYLLQWIRQPPPYDGRGRNYSRCALVAFRILGPKAKSAVPDLVKMIGQNEGYPERALLAIGQDAIPALTNRLIEMLSDTNYPFFQGVRIEVRHDSGYYVRGCILQVLDAMDTNAEPAIPALVKTVLADHSWYFELPPVDPDSPDPYAVLLNVGRNHPDIVMSALQQKETRTNLSSFERQRIGRAKADVGKDRTYKAALIRLPIPF